MRKLLVGFVGVIVLAFGQPLMASSMIYEDVFVKTETVDLDSNTAVLPQFWAELHFPDSPFGTYIGGNFEYDNFYSDSRVSSFSITLFGAEYPGYYSDQPPIDIFLSFNDSHSDGVRIASYDVPANGSFMLTLDILNNNILLNGIDVGDLYNLSYPIGALFVGEDRFWVGYACHFTHYRTSVNVSVPEPSMIMLLGLHLLGVWFWMRRSARRGRVRTAS